MKHQYATNTQEVNGEYVYPRLKFYQQRILKSYSCKKTKKTKKNFLMPDL